MKVVASGFPFSLPGKFVIPGLKVEYHCPECQTPTLADVSRCLAEMTANEPTTLDCFCSKCSHEWEEMVTVRVQLEPVASTVTP